MRPELIRKLENTGWRIRGRGRGDAPNVIPMTHRTYPDADLMIWIADDDFDEGTTIAHLHAGDVLLQIEAPGVPGRGGLMFTVYSQCSDDFIVGDLMGRGYR